MNHLVFVGGFVAACSILRTFYKGKDAPLKQRLIVGASVGLSAFVALALFGEDNRATTGKDPLELYEHIAIALIFIVVSIVNLILVDGDEIDTDNPNNVSIKDRVKKTIANQESTRNK